MTLQVELLKDNLQEIYHAIHTSEADSLPLVANIFGTRIYDSRFGWGRLWRWFYEISICLLNEDLRLDKMKQALLHTHTVFHQQMALLNRPLDEYLTYLQRSAKEYEVHEENMSFTRRSITQWNSATAPFVKMMKRLEHPRMEILLHHCFGDHLTKKELIELFAPQSTILLRTCQKKSLI